MLLAVKKMDSLINSHPAGLSTSGSVLVPLDVVRQQSAPGASTEGWGLEAGAYWQKEQDGS